MNISFFTHACFLINHNNTSILTDPWLEGGAFNNSWGLLNELSYDKIENKIQKNFFLYLSHEHPDHLSIGFFKKNRNSLIAKNCTILFQKTADKRVVNFLSSLNIKTMEVDFEKKLNLDNNLDITLYKCGFFDSAAIIETKDTTLFNLNDCDFNNDELNKISLKHSNNNNNKILATQFSYAAWRENEEWCKRAADLKIQKINHFSRVLKCNYLYPFASFIFFKKKENFFLNKNSNKPWELLKEKFISKLILPYPNTNNFKDVLKNDEIRKKNNELSSIYWKEQWGKNVKIDEEIEINYNVDDFIEEVKKKFLTFKSKNLEKNSFLFMKILNLISLNIFFKNITFEINFLNLFITLGFDKIIIKKDLPKNKPLLSIDPDVFLHFISTEYGLDSLITGGRFRTKDKKFMEKFILSFGHLFLNQIGKGISLRLLFDFFLWKHFSIIFYRLIKKEK